MKAIVYLVVHQCVDALACPPIDRYFYDSQSLRFLLLFLWLLLLLLDAASQRTQLRSGDHDRLSPVLSQQAHDRRRLSEEMKSRRSAMDEE